MNASIIDSLASSGRASRDELARLLDCDDNTARALYRAADSVRARAVGDDIHLRALVEFSNVCRRNCLYCGLRRGNSALHRYRMSPDSIVATVLEAARLGYGTAVLQSGEDPWYSAPMIVGIIRRIKAKADIAVTLSIGERAPEEYRLMREAGADRFLLRIETSSPILYQQLHPDSDWAVRVGCLAALRRLGYQVGSGVMIGLPGQTTEMLADDMLFLQALDLDMIGVGPFIPHPNTPLWEPRPRGDLSEESPGGPGSHGGRLGLSLRFVACLRLLCPEALIPATTALGALDPQGRQSALRAGANVLMPNCTPTQYREHYQLYPGKICTGESAGECRSCVQAIVESLGRRVAEGPGHSLRSERRAASATA
ncbi:MAG: [FeFe] hydrogenase H-cluster radical SAM maturase HydE [Armatimonadota bacterium]